MTVEMRSASLVLSGVNPLPQIRPIEIVEAHPDSPGMFALNFKGGDGVLLSQRAVLALQSGKTIHVRVGKAYFLKAHLRAVA